MVKWKVWNSTLWLAQNNIKSQLKKCRRVISWHWRVMQSLKKNWHVASNLKWGILWIFTQALKSPKILLRWAIFVMRFEQKKYRQVIFHKTDQWCKIWVNPGLVVSKMAWEIGQTFITAPKVWQIVNWWVFFLKSI